MPTIKVWLWRSLKNQQSQINRVRHTIEVYHLNREVDLVLLRICTKRDNLGPPRLLGRTISTERLFFLCSLDFTQRRINRVEAYHLNSVGWFLTSWGVDDPGQACTIGPERCYTGASLVQEGSRVVHVLGGWYGLGRMIRVGAYIYTALCNGYFFYHWSRGQIHIGGWFGSRRMIQVNRRNFLGIVSTS